MYQLGTKCTKFSEIYGCEKCGFSTQHEDNLKKHINDNHSQQSRYFYRQKRTHSPKIDNYTNIRDNNLYSIPDLKKHEPIHKEHNIKLSDHPVRNSNPNFKCEECDYCFSHDDEHKLHMEYFHSSQKKVDEQ